MPIVHALPPLLCIFFTSSFTALRITQLILRVVTRISSWRRRVITIAFVFATIRFLLDGLLQATVVYLALVFIHLISYALRVFLITLPNPLKKQVIFKFEIK